tara:strand:- start:104 stop:394 length:291 start_codon:yes stop_codon:yes gene_type:complete
MRKLFVLVFIFIIIKPLHSKNIFEIALLSAALPLIYDQYFDNSLSRETDYKKQQKILEKHSYNKINTNENINLRNRSDLVYYLSVIEELKLYSNNY